VLAPAPGAGLVASLQCEDRNHQQQTSSQHGCRVFY